MHASLARHRASLVSSLLAGLAACLVSWNAPLQAENTAAEPRPKQSEKWLARHEALNEEAKRGGFDLLYIGDSIVANYLRQGKESWDHYYADRHPLNLGIGGDRTEHVLWRLDNGNINGVHPKLAIVMIGQNNGGHNTGEEIAAGVTAIIQRLRDRMPDTKILLLGIFQRREKPTEERPVLARANEIISKLADGEKIVYLDINHLFVKPDGTIPADLMPDYEHPSPAGHQLWAETIEPTVAQLLGDTPKKPLQLKAQVQPAPKPTPATPAKPAEIGVPALAP